MTDKLERGVSDRKEFEKIMASSPYEKDVSRWPGDSSKYAWHGQYKLLDVQLAWEFWRHARDRGCWNDVGGGDAVAYIRQDALGRLKRHRKKGFPAWAAVLATPVQDTSGMPLIPLCISHNASVPEPAVDGHVCGKDLSDPNG